MDINIDKELQEISDQLKAVGLKMTHLSKHLNEQHFSMAALALVSTTVNVIESREIILGLISGRRQMAAKDN